MEKPNDTHFQKNFKSLILLEGGQPNVTHQYRQMIILIIICIVFVLTIIGFFAFRKWEQEHIEARFEKNSDRVANFLKNRFDDELEALYSLQSLYASSIRVERHEFHKFVMHILNSLPCMQALEWIPRVPDAERGVYEEAARKEGYPTFQFAELNAQGLMVRADRRTEYFPVYYVEPYQGNEIELGFDLASEFRRLTALKRACDTGKPIATEPITLVMETGNRAGFLVYLAIYSSDLPHDTIQERRKNLKGFVLGVFLIDTVINTMLQSLDVKNIKISVYDQSTPVKKQLIYCPLSNEHTCLNHRKGDHERKEGWPCWNTTLNFAGRQWLFTFYPTPEYFSTQKTSQPWIFLAGGLLITGILSVYSLSLYKHTSKMKHLVTAWTTELVKTNERLEKEIIEHDRANNELRNSKEKLQAILDNTTAAIFIKDTDGRYVLFNRYIKTLFNLTDDQYIGKTDYDYFPKENADIFRANDLKVIKAKTALEFEEVVPQKDGLHTYIAVKFPLYDVTGAIYAVGGISTDITGRKLAEEELRKMSRAVSQCPVTVMITDAKGNIEYTNPKFSQLTGYASEEVIGKNPRILKSGETSPEVYKHLWKTISAGNEWRGEIRNKKKNGELYWENISISAIKDNGVITHYVAVTEDITKHKQFESQIMYLASHDPVTNLFNRRRFQEELADRLAQAQRYSYQGAVLFLDIDNFKDVNDTMGHDAGDEILIKMAGLLLERMRKTDILARFGGDEFAILLSHVDENGALSIAGDIIEFVRKHTMIIETHTVHMTVSMGIALFPRHSSEMETLFTYADLALYHAKENGRNRFCIYTPDQKAKVESRRDWQSRIYEALRQDRFILYLQPIWDLKYNCIAGYEALLRMLDDYGEIIYPSQFISHVVRSRFIGEVNQLVVRLAIKAISEIHRRDKKQPFIGINLSERIFSDQKLISLIKQQLDTHKIDPKSIVIEITEDSVVSDMSEALNFIAELRAVGCRFAIDDFGIGSSSLNCLRELPVDYLKIDGSFIRNLPDDQRNQHMVKAMVEMARGLGKQTVAEYVGCEKTIQMLSEYGVDYVQGYYISKPVELHEILGKIH